MQQSTPTAFGDPRPFIFGERSGHLSQHAFGWRRPEAMTGKDDLATSPFKFLDDDVLISELSGEAIGRQDQHIFGFALSHGITQPIQSRPIQPCAAVAVILVNMLGADVKAILLRVLLERGKLRSDVLVKLLFGTGNASVNRSYFHRSPPELFCGVVKARRVSDCDGD